MRHRALRILVLALLPPILSQCAGSSGAGSLPQSANAQTHGAVAMSTTTTTVSGPIVATFSNGFTIQAGTSCGYLHIYTTSSTVFIPSGARPAVGMNAQATGTGSCATSLTATQVILSSASTNVPKHVLTGAYLFSNDGLTSHGRPFSAYTASLNWTETYAGTNASKAGIKTIYYTNPNRTESIDKLYTSDETTFAHTCTGARITQTGATTHTFYLMNPNSANLVNLYKSLVANELTQQHFDAIFDDEAYDWYALSAMPCNFNSTTWFNAYENEMKALGHPVIYNGLGILGSGGAISATIGFNAAAIGGMAEACYSASWNPHITFGSDWRGFENTEIAMGQQNKLFVCYSNSVNTASTSIALRTYVYASFLLTYNVNTSLIWEYFATTSGYTVEPESQLVALSPAVATPSSISGLLTSTGVYGRKYGACYIAGKSVGPCAAVVNSDNLYSHAFPYTGYHHTLLLTGGGILDGGTISTQGAAPPATLAPLTAAIAFQ